MYVWSGGMAAVLGGGCWGVVPHINQKSRLTELVKTQGHTTLAGLGGLQRAPAGLGHPQSIYIDISRDLSVYSCPLKHTHAHVLPTVTTAGLTMHTSDSKTKGGGVRPKIAF